MPRLIEMDWPDHGRPALPPPLSLSELRGRMAAFREGLAAGGHAVGAVYGDREHAANLHWLTGFDPRFEEALLLVLPGEAHLLVGNECLPYAGLSPLAEAGEMAVHLVPSLSLTSQPRDGMTVPEAVRRLVPAGAAVGAVGWKMFEPGDGAAHAFAAFLLDPLRDRAGRIGDATGLLMHPGHGLRTTVTAEGIARLEFANAAAARALRRLIGALREGAVDFDVLEAAGLPGLPLAAHVTFATGARAFQGLSSPTGQVVRRGVPISFNVAPWGANLCRAGWVAESEADLPAAAQGYLGDFVFPYAEAMSDWCALMRPGVAGGAVWERMAERLPFDVFGVALNPGHLIGMDEWISSPVSRGSEVPLRSGMAMQMDVIPSHPAFGSTRIEDGYVVADGRLRADLAARFPEVEGRCAARAAVMRERLGFEVPRTLLPLSDTCGLLAPFLLAPRRVVALG